MTCLVDLSEVKANLSQFVEAAARGEEIVIAVNGKPVVRLVPHSKTAPRKRAVGQWRDTIDPLFHADPQRFWEEWDKADASIADDFRS